MTMHAITLIILAAAAFVPDTNAKVPKDPLIGGSVYTVVDGVESVHSYFYSSVCRPDIVAKSNKNFTLDRIANSGDFKFVYVTGYNTIACAITEFHGDSEIGYRRSVTLLDHNGKTTKIYYQLKEISPGVISETYENTNRMGKSFTNSYKLIIMSWDNDLGVLEYVRCSDIGRKHSDDRYIVVNACTTDNDSPSIQKAEELYEADDSMGFNGPAIHQITQCGKQKAYLGSTLH